MATPAQQIAARISESAYMSYAFSEGAYHRIACFLLAEGLTPAEAEAIMDSKHVRWSYDAGDGEATSGTFKRYYAKNRTRILSDAAQWGDSYEGAVAAR